jgi:methylglutaconyl-CoA hydratase
MPNPITDPLVENVIVDDVASVVAMDTTADGVATVTLNRGGARNALNRLMIEGLTEAFETLQGADHVRIAFLRGAGADFCAGLDLRDLQSATEPTEPEARQDALAVGAMLKALADVPAITVALVHGAALGDGLGLVAACDVAVAVRGARFAFPEVDHGLIPAMSAPYVVGAIGPRSAKALFVTGRTFDSDYAAAIGLVHEVAEDLEGLEGVRTRLIADARNAAPQAVAHAKRLAFDMWRRRVDHGLIGEAASQLAERRVSTEGLEGVAAAVHHRKPEWAR